MPKIPLKQSRRKYDETDIDGWDNTWDNAGWYLTCPGSVVDALLTFGYRF